MLICMEARQPGQKYNHMVDMWAFGVLMYLLMYGHYPRLDWQRVGPGADLGAPALGRNLRDSEVASAIPPKSMEPQINQVNLDACWCFQACLSINLEAHSS